MKTLLRRVALLVGAASLLLVAACGGAVDATTRPSTTGGTEVAFSFGAPAAPAQAARVIEVIASDKLTFDPTDITVSPGETITFRVVNEGQIPHDFTLGDETAQAEHEEEMAEGGGMAMPDQPNAIVLAAGETSDITWKFPESGTVIFGCHQPGHYAAGMRGEIRIES